MRVRDLLAVTGTAPQLYLAVIGAGYVIQAIGTLRAEEADGRLEARLGGTLSRVRWLTAHCAVIAAGLVLIVVGSSLVLALSTAWSVGNTDEFGAIMGAGLSYLQAELVLAGLALALFGRWPRVRLGGVRRGDLHRLPRVHHLPPSGRTADLAGSLTPTHTRRKGPRPTQRSRPLRFVH